MIHRYNATSCLLFTFTTAAFIFFLYHYSLNIWWWSQPEPNNQGIGLIIWRMLVQTSLLPLLSGPQTLRIKTSAKGFKCNNENVMLRGSRVAVVRRTSVLTTAIKPQNNNNNNNTRNPQCHRLNPDYHQVAAVGLPSKALKRSIVQACVSHQRK